jgi:hypothetical protein
MSALVDKLKERVGKEDRERALPRRRRQRRIGRSTPEHSRDARGESRGAIDWRSRRGHSEARGLTRGATSSREVLFCSGTKIFDLFLTSLSFSTKKISKDSFWKLQNVSYSNSGVSL